MRKAAAFLVVLLVSALVSALPAGPRPEAASERRDPSRTAPAGGPAAASFSLAKRPSLASPAGPPSLDLQDPADMIIAENIPEVPAASLVSEPAASRLSVSFFFGPRGGDVFASLHKAYAWRPMSRSLTVGLGLYREIPIYRGIGLLPYVGIIRASATLSLAGRHGNRESIEYRLTAFCVGLPLVVRFN